MENPNPDHSLSPQARARIDSPLHTQHSPISENPDTTPSRQSRLLQSRNARFSAKRLSVTRLGSKIAQRTRNEDLTANKDAMRNKENTPPLSRTEGIISDEFSKSSPKGFSKIVGRDRPFSSTSSPRVVRATSGEAVEGRRKLTKRHSSPLIYQSPALKSELSTDSSFSTNSTKSVRLREVSGNENRISSFDLSPRTGSYRQLYKQKSMQIKSQYATDTYIEHIENELRQAQNALISPTTNKSLHHQLRSSRSENDRLKRELAEMRTAFETEVKTALEQKATIEAELKRRVKYLEDELEGKASVIEELEYQHAEKRLDSSILDTLKATIEKLEAEKLSMAQENRSMTKRNEVLSELLAMSPSKSRPPFELRSPIREKRPGRPMSLIIPRLPTSPIVAPDRSHMTSPTTSSPLVTSSQYPSLASEIDPLCLNDLELQRGSNNEMIAKKYCGQAFGMHSKRQSHSDASAAGSVCSPSLEPSQYPLQSSPVHEHSIKHDFKRKPRKFMHGSTQLKPLLLSTLRNDTDSQSSASALESPGHMVSGEQYQDMWETNSYFGTTTNPMPSNGQSLLDPSSPDSTAGTGIIAEPYSHRQTAGEIIADDTTTHSTYSREPGYEPETSDGLAQMLEESLTGPGPVLSDDENAGDKNCNEVGLVIGHIGGDVYYHDSPLTTVERGFDQQSPGSSSPFNLDALRKLQLPDTYSDSLSPSAIDHVRPSSVIPEPLFSPLSKSSGRRIAASQAGTCQDHDMVIDSRGHKRQRSRPVVDDTILSPRPLGSNSSALAFLGGFPDGNAQSFSTPNSKRTSFKPPSSPLSTAAISLSRSMTPLELLNRRQFGARPLAAFTIRTICTALSRCTTFVRDVKSDPLALARKVLANAWFANWKRFGRLSWWVLGLFLPQKLGKPIPQWDWDDYDAEEIAQRCCDENYVNNRKCDMMPNDHIQQLSLTAETTLDQNVTLQSSMIRETDSNPGWCKSIFLWGKFSVAMMLAVGGAVVNGPADMMRDIERRQSFCAHKPPNCPGCIQLNGGQIGHCTTDPHERSISNSSRDDMAWTIFDQAKVPRRSEGDDGTGPTNNIDSSPSFTSQSLRHALELGPMSEDWSPTDDRTLKPVKLRKKHIQGVFRQTAPNRAISTGSEIQNWSGSGSTDDGFLMWPPDLEVVHSNCTSSTSDQSHEGVAR